MSSKFDAVPKVKICGICSVDDALAASHAGADAIGMVFYPPSSRHMHDLALAGEIAQAVGPLTQVVSLFVDAEASYIESILAKVSVNTIQFHGNETVQYCEQFDHPYIKALRMKPGLDVIEKAADFISARGLLLDTYVKGVPGGTGEAFNWDRVPTELNNIILAGGLTPQNVAQAIQIAKPYAVDVSGGVELKPGKKDSAKISAFIKQAKLEYKSE